mmetsp:Transcript_7220/g.22775  ORF Transcript_7220/g.22775 Transcript_7220/m.22775 type:complete len:211 (-) Transcript_7220:452-1084(-)
MYRNSEYVEGEGRKSSSDVSATKKKRKKKKMMKSDKLKRSITFHTEEMYANQPSLASCLTSATTIASTMSKKESSSAKSSWCLSSGGKKVRVGVSRSHWRSIEMVRKDASTRIPPVCAKWKKSCTLQNRSAAGLYTVKMTRTSRVCASIHESLRSERSVAITSSTLASFGKSCTKRCPPKSAKKPVAVDVKRSSGPYTSADTSSSERMRG